LSVWNDGPFEYLEPQFVERTTDDYLKEFQKNQKYYRVKIKQDLIDNPVCKFKVRSLDTKILKELVECHCRVKQKIRIQPSTRCPCDSAPR